MNPKYTRITIIIPCYNEESTLKKVLQKVLESDTLSLKKEIIVVNDKSTDNTEKILQKFKNNKEIKILSLAKNTGKGGAVKTGLLQSTGDIVIIQDADFELDPSEYPSLIGPIIEGKADIVYGSRFLSGRPHSVISYQGFVKNKLLTILSNIFTNLNLTDMETCYKVFKGEIVRKIAPTLESKRFGFEPEITARLAKIKGIKFYEVPISYIERNYNEGKHIQWTDGIKAVMEIIKFNIKKS